MQWIVLLKFILDKIPKWPKSDDGSAPQINSLIRKRITIDFSFYYNTFFIFISTLFFIFISTVRLHSETTLNLVNPKINSENDLFKAVITDYIFEEMKPIDSTRGTQVGQGPFQDRGTASWYRILSIHINKMGSAANIVCVLEYLNSGIEDTMVLNFKFQKTAHSSWILENSPAINKETSSYGKK